LYQFISAMLPAVSEPQADNRESLGRQADDTEGDNYGVYSEIGAEVKGEDYVNVYQDEATKKDGYSSPYQDEATKKDGYSNPYQDEAAREDPYENEATRKDGYSHPSQDDGYSHLAEADKGAHNYSQLFEDQAASPYSEVGMEMSNYEGLHPYSNSGERPYSLLHTNPYKNEAETEVYDLVAPQ
jgi:hypothetical protein